MPRKFLAMNQTLCWMTQTLQKRHSPRRKGCWFTLFLPCWFGSYFPTSNLKFLSCTNECAARLSSGSMAAMWSETMLDELVSRSTLWLRRVLIIQCRQLSIYTNSKTHAGLFWAFLWPSLLVFPLYESGYMRFILFLAVHLINTNSQ